MGECTRGGRDRRGKFSGSFNKGIYDLGELVLDGAEAGCDEFFRVKLCVNLWFRIRWKVA